ncbi:hypothetical protein I4F81_000594 [Pyropia yezoensis]|uniref:Uncharacterized protein n=1 Tax=Pyropia yezoensis TaxID=2788 RepID=A0ACC3BJ42_PYRYE|nr:hypothetical protein I4F81_000594 [Neopyropia yezoensis]
MPMAPPPPLPGGVSPLALPPRSPTTTTITTSTPTSSTIPTPPPPSVVKASAAPAPWGTHHPHGHHPPPAAVATPAAAATRLNVAVDWAALAEVRVATPAGEAVRVGSLFRPRPPRRRGRGLGGGGGGGGDDDAAAAADGGHTILVFLNRSATSYSTESRPLVYARLRPTLDAARARLVFVTPAPPAAAARWLAAWEAVAPFPGEVVCDPGAGLAAGLGLLRSRLAAVLRPPPHAWRDALGGVVNRLRPSGFSLPPPTAEEVAAGPRGARRRRARRCARDGGGAPRERGVRGQGAAAGGV